MSQAPNTGGHLEADGALVSITLLWALTFVVVKDALAGVDPFTFLVLRFALGAAALSLVARKALLHRESLRAGLVLGPLLFFGFAFQTVGLLSTTPSRSAFITGLYVVLVPLLSTALLRRLPRPTSLAGVALATLGLYVLTHAGGEGTTRDTLLGDALTLGGAVAYALHITLNERFAPRAIPAGLVAVQLWMVAGLSALCLPFVEQRFTPSFPVLFALGLCGLFASAVAITLQTWAQARTSAVRAVVIFSLEPVFAALFSVLAGREVLGQRELLGGGLVVLAVLVSEVGAIILERWRQRRSAPAQA
jgi:drug/metabolite transporter (DMT)-like permease